MKKKKILFHSNHSRAFTGFGKNAKNILRYLYSTGKYEVVEYAAGVQWSNPELKKLPWKCYGTLPDDPNAINELNKDPGLARAASYGALNLDRVIQEEKPDVYISCEDFWANTCCNAFDKKWWNKIHCLVHTTLDSVPILPDAVKYADKILHYFVWSKFAEKELHKLGHKHVKTLYGAVDTSPFYRLPDTERQKLRKRFNISDNAFVIGFVFRNQLRKSAPNLLQGFKTFLQQNPSVDAYLLLHTHWSEGWDLPRLIEEFGIDNKRVLTTYFCRQCYDYSIRPFEGQDKDCGYCQTKGAQITTNVAAGVDEKQLNEIYNIMDVYCHPFTSGGFEYPLPEVKATEKITLCTNYVCGEEHCSDESGGLPLEWAEYREPGTQFIKASTYPSSIAKQLAKVFNLNPTKKRELEKRARQYVLDNYDTSVIGKQLEDYIDSLSDVTYDFNFLADLKNPNANIPDIQDNKEWLKRMYKDILLMEVGDDDGGLNHWLEKLKQGANRTDIHNYFKYVAEQENTKNNAPAVKLEDFFEPEIKENKVALVLPCSFGDIMMATSLLKSARELYKGWRIYFVCEPKHNEVLEPLVGEYIDKIIPFHPQMENQLWMEGQNDWRGVVDVVKYLHFPTQRQLNYLNNGKDKIAFDLK